MAPPNRYEIDIPDDASPTIRAAVEWLLNLARTLIEKNKKYGDSAANPMRVFAKASPVEQVLVRIDDKLTRIARGAGLLATDEDTVRDLAGYLAIYAALRATSLVPEERGSFIPEKHGKNATLCVVDGCASPRIGGQYCNDHRVKRGGGVCASSGCYRPVRDGYSLCPVHAHEECSAADCWRPVVLDAVFCEQHEEARLAGHRIIRKGPLKMEGQRYGCAQRGCGKDAMDHGPHCPEHDLQARPQ